MLLADKPLNNTDPRGLWRGGCPDIGANSMACTVYTVNGAEVPSWVGQSVISSGAGVQCPNNDCNGVTAQANGEVYKNVYGPNLTLNCNGASTSDMACWWSNWSKHFVLNANDIYVNSSMGNWEERSPDGPGMSELRRNSAGAGNFFPGATGVVASPV